MPITKFDDPSGTSGNKGSCKEFLEYLEKTDNHKGMDKSYFFSHINVKISSKELVHIINSKLETNKVPLNSNTAQNNLKL